MDGLQHDPVVGGEADLLAQLPLRAVQLGLSVAVEGAGGDLEAGVLADHLARLANEVDDLVVVGEDPDRPGMFDQLAFDQSPLGPPEAADG